MKNSVKKLYQDFFAQYPQLSVCSSDIAEAFEAICNCYRTGGKLLVCGNGGSASDAEHIVGELMNKFAFRRPAPEQMRERLHETVQRMQIIFSASSSRGLLPFLW
jgi:D-sedoheptulose 7-phosphate isomerase